LFGEESNEKEANDVTVMPTPSIASISRRVKELHDAINYTEDYVRKIHSTETPLVASH